jgi:sterol 14-demethylase
MLAILQPIVQERRRHPEAYDDFLQEFVNSRYKDGREVEDEVIMNLILGLMFAGHETTAGQAAWTVIELARHPAYLALVREELQECLPAGTALDLERMAGLQVLEWAVREVSRLHPSADMLLRQAEEDVDVGDYVVPKGWVVFVTSAQAHRLEELFEEPAAFDPLRFAPGREEDRQHKFAMIPFGGGVHKCTGMNFAINEMMAINALLFQQFDVELVTRDPQVFYGMGAARPEPTILRYRRRS